MDKTPSMSEAMFALMTSLNEFFSQVPSACLSYKNDCEAIGFSTSAAEAMALTYHTLLMSKLAALLDRMSR